jgi:signal transduction histidine kinase
MRGQPRDLPAIRAVDLLWIAFLSLWIVLLFVLGRLFIDLRASPLLGGLVLLVANGVGIATAGLLLFHSPRIRSLRMQARQFQTFCRAIKQAAGTLELQEILDSAAQVVTEVTGVRGCSIKLLEPGTGRMRARTAVGLERGVIDQALDALERTYQPGMLTRESLVVRDIFMRDFPSVDEEFESLICVPLRLEEQILGTICIFGERGQKLPQEMIALLASLGDVVSLAIAHAFVYENLKNLVEAKTRFLFQASHELRSPLTAIVSMAKTLQEGHLGELAERQKEMIGRIALRAQTLSEIVGDLLVLARGRARLATLKPVRVNLRKLLEEDVRLFEAKVQEKGIGLQVHDRAGEAGVKGNAEGLHSVVTNLLANAIKYTPEGGRIDLRLFESKEQLVLEVSDSGIGIPKGEQDRLFSEFFRASNACSISRVGTGLGLVIVKSIVTQHGGSIDVESEEGKGTTFRIFLPKAGD